MRSIHVTGPGVVTYNGITYYTEGDIIIKHPDSVLEVVSAVYGPQISLIKERIATISFKPIGECAAADLTAVFSITSNRLGGNLAPATDLPVVVIGNDGASRSYAGAIITKLPNLALSAGKTLYKDDIIITALGAQTTWTAANSLFTHTATGVSLPANSLATADIFVSNYSAVWTETARTGSPWTGIITREGWDLDFDLKLVAVPSDAWGTYDYIIDGFGVKASCIPHNVTAADVVAVINDQGTTSYRGAAYNTAAGVAADLVLTSTGAVGAPKFTVKTAQLIDRGDIGFGRTTPRTGKLVWESHPVAPTTIANWLTIAAKT
jgi:hypothetical protein